MYIKVTLESTNVYKKLSGQDSGSKNNSSNLNKNPYVSNNDITSQYSCGECGNSVNVFENFYNLTNQFKNNTQQKAVYWNNDTTGAFNESGTLKRKMFEIVV
ncbi:hypothetical protein A3Q56_01286 [Intoshia linei]|uniref:Uncharacterized protein n=1 Tax=Intoshia linei TaxID=1819745 RepID=A0A177BBA5_9BILA|nr:hypothetical protein A3Q56_01286 [Intoshia linei]